MKRMTVLANVDLEGFHYWPKAISEVEFLRYKHRHVFKISVGCRVEHSDRQVEIFMLRDDIKKIYSNSSRSDGTLEFGSSSCEDICIMLQHELQRLGYDISFVQVMEEETGGARVEWDEK